MAQPSSSHHDESRHRHRSERSSHHHHRTISSTTLLLILSLVLAVLAVMLSLPSNSPLGGGGSGNPADPATSGVWNYLTPKRTQQLISRESNVAAREAEVARREAELLAGAPGGVIAPTPTPVSCPPCIAATTVETIIAPAQTVIKEIVKEDSLTPPGWSSPRIDDILDRELKIADREREISKREEIVNRREHDASRRESWIMEQLIALGNDQPVGPGTVVEDEYIYEQPPPPKRKAKYLPQYQEPAPPLVVSEVQYETEIHTVTETVHVPSPASTRPVAFPTPEVVQSYSTTFIPKTTAVEIITEEEVEEEEEEVPVPRPRPVRRPPAGAGPGWLRW
ncbi:hypothetical protein VKT23_004206 [Stygiomarasmius scandens]|uniref:Transmembrane protein n=1 Tax=Marasmiellus scandens TaxID=2682957 RepID=A0ABR1JZW4_9AGAR